MKKLLLLTCFIIYGFGLQAQLPELIYYQFDDGPSSVTNYASSPVGTNPAPITGLTTASGGFLSSNALSGTGASSGTDKIVTGWNTTINGSFTLAFWTSNVPSSTTLYYIFGDGGASSFRCFTNGVAGANNWMVRGAGFPDLLVSGAATTASNMIHVVYDATAGTYTSYVDGVQNTQVTVATVPNQTGTGLTVGGYTTSSSLNGLMDEFRWYNRALTVSEIQSTYNADLNVAGNCANAFSAFTIDSITGTGAKIDWVPGTGNNSFYLEYGASGFTPGSGITVSGTYPGGQPPVILTGLNPNSTYDVYFGEICNSGADSVYLPSPMQFTTTRLCAAPTNFAVANITTTSAQFSWNTLGNPNSFNIIHGAPGFNPASAGTVSNVPSSPATVSTLTGSTDYEAYLYADCGATDGLSDTIGPIAFRTPCVIATAPFTENFDGSIWVASGANAGNAIDPCWTASPDMSQGTEPFKWIPRSTGPTSGNGPTIDATGGNFMYVEASGSALGDIAYLTTPPIDVSNLTTPALYFMEHRYSGGTIADMDVEVSSDGGATWTTEYSVTGDVQTSASAPWELRFVNLGNYTGDTITLRFTQLGKGCCGDAAIDSIVVDEAPLCPWPTALNVSGITNTTAVIGWNDPSATTWTIEWGPCGFSQGTGGSQTTTNNPYTITGLAGNTCYDVYVRADCTAGGNGNSIWMGPISFTTRCNSISAPYSSNFDTDPLNEPPVCWDNYLKGASSQFSAASVYNFGTPQSGTQHVRFYNYNNDTTMLIGPEFNDLTAGDKMIEFYAQTASAGTNHDLIIGTVSSFDDPQSFVPIDTVNLSTAYAFFQVHLNAANGYNGTHDHVAFYHASTSTFITYYIDDFNYLEIPACPGSLISTLGINNLSDVTGTAVWSGGQGDITNIEWGSVGFMPGVGGSIGSATVAGTVDMYNITGLNPQTTYEYYIQDSCNATGSGNWVGPFSFTTLCTVTIMPYYESFDTWPLTCWQNDEGTHTWTDQAGVGTDHYALANFWSVSLGNYVLKSRPISITQDAQIKLDWSHLYNSAYPNDQLLLMVQNISKSGQYDTILNLIGPSFNDPSAGNTTAGQFITEEIILDPTLYTGDTIVVTLWANSGFGPNLYINDFYVENAPSCAPPSSISVSGVLDTAATLNWGNNPNALQYQIWFGPQGFYQGSQTTTGVKSLHTTNSYLIDTLSDNSCYEYLVRVICGPNDTSGWIGPVSFCTQCRPFSMPYYEGFNTWPPSCWDPELGTIPWNGASGWAEADFWGNASGNMIMSSPPIMVSQNAQVRYKWSHLASASYPDDELIVRATVVGSGVWDTLITRKSINGNFHDPTAANTAPGAGIEDVFALDPTVYTGNLVIIQFWGNTDFGPNLYIDDFYVEVPPTCLKPLNFANFSIGANDLSFTWNGASTTTGNYIIEYGSSTLGAPGNTTVVVSNDSVTLTGLMANTNYCVWLRDVCTPGDSSAWVGPICVTTSCVTVMAPFVENFENMTLGFTSGVDNCWNLVNSGAYEWELRNTAQTTSTGTGPDRDNTLAPAIGGKFFNADVSYGVNGDSTILISPSINISNLSNPELEYHLHRYGTIMADFYVDIYDGTNWIRGVHSYTNVAGFNISPSDPYHDTIINLSAYIGTTNFRVRFRSETNGCCAGDNALDDIRISDPVSCPSPGGLSAVAVSNTSATIDWDTTGFGAATYQISYGSPGFTAGTGTQTTVSGNNYNITGLTTTNLCLDAYVRAICAVGDTSLWVGPISVCPQADPCDDMEAYNTGEIDGQSALLLGWAGAGGDGSISTAQASSGTQSLHIHTSGPAAFSDIVAVFDSPYTSGIHNVEFDFYIPTGMGGYYNILHNYTGAANVWAIEVYLDMSGSATVNQGTNGTGTIGTYNFNMGAWNTVEHIIDLDNDTAWIMINGANANVGWQFSLGSTNMGDRFNAVNFYSAANVGQTPDIYFDDLCVSPYVPISGCDDPTTLAASNITCGDAVLSWNSSTSMASSVIVYGPAGFNPVSGGTVTTATTGTVGISGLTANTAYDFYVVDICNNGDTSNAVGPVSFTTLGGPISSDFTSTNGAPSAVNMIVSFDASASVGADTYDWDFGDGGVANTTTPNTSHSYSLNGKYQVCLTITGACGTDVYCDSVTVAGISLTENYLARSLSVYPNPSSNLLNISFDAQGSDEASLRLMDLSGKLIMEINEKVSGTEFKQTLNISQLAKGVYLLEVVNGDNKAVRRITKE